MNLYSIRGIWRPKAITPLLAVLDELEYEYSYIAESFKIVRVVIENNMYVHIKTWKVDLEETRNPRINIWVAINHVTYEHLQSGKYHAHRGEVAEYGAGKGLLELYEQSLKELVRLKNITKKQALEDHEVLDEAIASVG